MVKETVLKSCELFDINRFSRHCGLYSEERLALGLQQDQSGQIRHLDKTQSKSHLIQDRLVFRQTERNHQLHQGFFFLFKINYSANEVNRIFSRSQKCNVKLSRDQRDRTTDLPYWSYPSSVTSPRSILHQGLYINKSQEQDENSKSFTKERLDLYRFIVRTEYNTFQITTKVKAQELNHDM